MTFSGDGDLPEPIPQYHVRMADTPAAERPRERLLQRGPQALSTAELLAILLRTGTQRENVKELADRLIRERGLRGLAAADLATLQSEPGVASAKATTILAAFELGRRLATDAIVQRPQITQPEDIARILPAAELELLQQEELRLLILDTKHRLIGKQMMYRGSLNSAPARVAEIFREAVRQNGAAIAVAHNHPSGDPTPSTDDIEFTRSLIDAGNLFEMKVLDHLIVGHGRYVSLRERRLGGFE